MGMVLPACHLHLPCFLMFQWVYQHQPHNHHSSYNLHNCSSSSSHSSQPPEEAITGHLALHSMGKAISQHHPLCPGSDDSSKTDATQIFSESPQFVLGLMGKAHQPAAPPITSAVRSCVILYISRQLKAKNNIILYDPPPNLQLEAL